MKDITFEHLSIVH